MTGTGGMARLRPQVKRFCRRIPPDFTKGSAMRLDQNSLTCDDVLLLPARSAVLPREAIDPIILRIEDMVKVALEQTPPELAKDIVDQGIIMSGGVSQLRGLSERLSRSLNTPVVVAEDPLFAVARGVGKILDNLDVMKRVLMSVEKGSR